MLTPITSRFSKAVVATVVAGALSLGVVAASPASASTRYEPEPAPAAHGLVGFSAPPASQSDRVQVSAPLSTGLAMVHPTSFIFLL